MFTRFLFRMGLNIFVINDPTSATVFLTLCIRNIMEDELSSPEAENLDEKTEKAAALKLR